MDMFESAVISPSISDPLVCVINPSGAGVGMTSQAALYSSCRGQITYIHDAANNRRSELFMNVCWRESCQFWV